MVNFSYVQTDFRGGIWSPSAQGRMVLPEYKTALNESLNGMPQEDGSWVRRPGFRFVGYPRNGQKARLLPFRFSRSQSYQAELTPGKLRFVVGLTHLREVTSAPIPKVIGISLDTPAVVRVNSSTLPWVNGDIVMFDINSTPPASYRLFGRQFTINNVSQANGTFTLSDSVTGADISGADIAFVRRSTSDTVQKILEYVTPYTLADLPNVRIVQDSKTTVLFLCPGYAPYALIVSGLSQFTFGKAQFQDGPYLDINELTTTLALSAITGSVTVTASGTANINDGDGFKSTDVDRLIWFQSGPAAWSGATVYAKEDKVLGSDNNIYRSLISNNLNNSPLTDTGTKWEITSDQVIVTWLKITGVTDTTHVTATISGPTAIKSGTATINWRLGVYCATLGFPTCGAYHEGRLCLAGAVENRVDMSKSFKALTFSPTETDGTISDSNGISFTLNNRDSEILSWMMATEEGLVLGTLAGEWIIRASTLDDPLSPTSVQARNTTNYGSAPIEPVQAYGQPLFVQARGRKAMTHRRSFYSSRAEIINLSKLAPGLTAPLISEIAWSQEPMLSLFCRLSNGKLVGATYKYSLLDESFLGWHRHDHGMGRTFEALSYGPNFSGTSDSIYVVSAGTTGPRWIEVMMPAANEGDPGWVAWHTDGSGTGWFIRRMILVNGDAYDGIKVYGLDQLEGQTIHPYVGGLDLGNFVVTNGSIDLPYSGTFTAAFLASINDGTDYSNWGIKLRWADAPVTTNPLNPLNTVTVEDNEITSTFSGVDEAWDRDNEVFYRFGTGAQTDIRVFDALNGNLLREAQNANAIFPIHVGHTIYETAIYGSVQTYVRPDATFLNGSLFLLSYFAGTANDYRLSQIDAKTLVEANVVYFSDINHIPKTVFSVPFYQLDPILLVPVYSQIGLVNFQGNPARYTIISLTDIGGLGAPILTALDEAFLGSYDFIKWCRGFETPGMTTWYSASPIGNFSITSWAGATSADIYEWTLSGVWPNHIIKKRKIVNLLPSAIDPTWTAFDNFSITYDANDSRLLVIAQKRSAAIFNAAKISTDNGAVFFSVVAPNVVAAMPGMSEGPWNYNRWAFISNSTGIVYNLDLTTGAWTTLTGQASGITNINQGHGHYDEVGPSVITLSNFNGNTGSPNPPTQYIGTWANAHAPIWAAQNYNRLWLGLSYTQDQTHRALNAQYYFNPVNFGVSFISRGQLLRPDFGQDAGTQAGPAFGKTRRNHQYAISFSRAFNVKVGTDFTRLFNVKFTTDGGTALAQPTLFSGIVSDTLDDDYTFEGKIAWQITRQYPCTITAVGGFIQAQDR